MGIGGKAKAPGGLPEGTGSGTKGAWWLALLAGSGALCVGALLGACSSPAPVTRPSDPAVTTTTGLQPATAAAGSTTAPTTAPTTTTTTTTTTLPPTTTTTTRPVPAPATGGPAGSNFP